MSWNIINLPVFFIIFRETLEASIIISVLISLLQNIVVKDPAHSPSQSLPEQTTDAPGDSSAAALSPPELGREESWDDSDERRPLIRRRSVPDINERDLDDSTPEHVPALDDTLRLQRLVRKLKQQIFLGAGLGFLTAMMIGAILILVYFETVADKWSQAEDLWEAGFSLLASILIFFMALAILRMDRAKTKWRAKLQAAVSGKTTDTSAYSSNYALFLLPYVTVLREGLEAVVFVAGVSLSAEAKTIPPAVALGIILGLLVGWAIWMWGSHGSLKIFLVFSTNILLLIGAGLMSNAVGAWERHRYNLLVGGDAAESGTGPGSYPLAGNIWHLDCCSPENKATGDGWAVLGSVIGWSNNGSVYTVSAYMLYWIAVVGALVRMMSKEGRFKPKELLSKWL